MRIRTHILGVDPVRGNWNRTRDMEIVRLRKYEKGRGRGIHQRQEETNVAALRMGTHGLGLTLPTRE